MRPDPLRELQMREKDSTTDWIQGIRRADSLADSMLSERRCPGLARLAGLKLEGKSRRLAGEDRRSATKHGCRLRAVEG